MPLFPHALRRAVLTLGALLAVSAIAAEDSHRHKDVVLDTRAASAAATAASAATAAASAMASNAVPASLAELALATMRRQSTATGNAQTNAVLSPVGITTALGLVRTGAKGPAARELAGVFGASRTGEQAFDQQYPRLLAQLNKASNKADAPYVMASRVWVDTSTAPAVPATYAAKARQRFGADGAVLALSDAEQARRTINEWVLAGTYERVPDLLPAGAVKPNTRLVVANAVHFKSAWAQPFDARRTTLKPFHALGGDKPVDTMRGVMSVRTGVYDNITVHELPFENENFVLLVGLPPAGHTLNAFETDLKGRDVAAWSKALKPATCNVELPRFSLTPAARSLKPALQALGVKTMFTPKADFSPMLGTSAQGVAVDDVFHAASIVIDEQGGEASAGTAMTLQAKSMAFAQAQCIVDQPFIFALLHRPTGLPLFVGKVADPGLP